MPIDPVRVNLLKIGKERDAARSGKKSPMSRIGPLNALLLPARKQTRNTVSFEYGAGRFRCPAFREVKTELRFRDQPPTWGSKVTF